MTTSNPNGLRVTPDRHAAIQHYGQNELFAWGHLQAGNPEAAELSSQFGAVAQAMLDQVTDDNPETAKALGKLLEAKDCAVRALLIQQRKQREADAVQQVNF